MEGKHTPGPWTTGTPGKGRFCVYAPEEHGRGICVMSNTQKSWDAAAVAKYGEHEANLIADANAALIAAAPAMLEALDNLTVACGEADALQHAGLNVPPKVWSAIYQANMDARAAIAQARKVRP